MLFKKKEKRTIISWLHVWGGRLAILLGIINGGFGLKLGMVRFSGYRAAYGVVATVMGVLFIFSIIFAEVRRGAENPSLRSRRGKGAALNREEEGQDVRMESMDRERLTASGGRVE